MDALPNWWRVLENRSSLSGIMITEVSKRGESEVVGIGILNLKGIGGSETLTQRNGKVICLKCVPPMY